MSSGGRQIVRFLVAGTSIAEFYLVMLTIVLEMFGWGWYLKKRLFGIMGDLDGANV